MKHKGNTFEFMRERNRDLWRAYRTQLATMKFIEAQRLMTNTVAMPARRFYVSEERARKVINAMLRGDDIRHMKSTSRRMFKEIYRRVMAAKYRQPHLSTHQIIIRVIYEEAPEFYITPQSAAVIISKIRTGKYPI